MSTSPRVSLRGAADVLARRAFRRELAAVVALLVAFQIGRIAIDAALDPYFLDSDIGLLLVESVLGLGWTAALVSLYAARRGYPLPVTLPDRIDGRLVAAVLATAVLAMLPFLSLAARMDVGVEHVAATLADLGDVFTVRTLLRIGLFVPSMALLSHGLIQGTFRQVFDGEAAPAVAVTTLLGGYLAAPTAVGYGGFGTGPWLSLWGGHAAAAVLFVLALGVVGAAAEWGDRRARALAWLPVLVALAAVVAVLAPDARFAGSGIVLATRTAVIGVGAAAYAESDSLAAPALVYATFAAVSSVLRAASLTAAFG